MRKSFLTTVAALGAVALVSGLLAVTASAHIGASHSPIDTDLPDLTSVERVSDDEADFCFDEVVTDFSAAGDFILSGYDADHIAVGDDADPDPDKDDCILVQFDEDRDVANFTIGYVLEGAAETRGGDGSTANAAELEGSTVEDTEGDTVAPNLLDWDASGSDEIEYTFDEQVNCDRAEAADPGTWGFYDDDGNLEEGDGVTDCDDDDGTVTVEFTTGEDVDDAVRVYVSETQGEAENCEPAPVSTDGCTSVESDGDAVDDFPNLDSVERTDDDQWTFVFDEDIDETSCAMGLFHIYQEDGTELSGTACDEDTDEVEVTFAVEDEVADSEFPLAAVDGGAVDDDDDGNPSTIGSASPADSGEEVGLTDAPDLEVVQGDVNDGIVSYFFDENVDDNFSFDENDFLIVDQDGDTISGDDIDDAEDNVVTVEFDGDDIDDAIGGAVEDDAAADFNGDLSEPAAAGFGTASTTTATTTSSGPSASTPPPPSVIKAGTTLSIHYDRTPARRAAFKGSVKSRFHKCEIGRQIELHKKGTGVVGRDSSNRKGKWKVRYPRAQGQFFATVLRKVYTRADGVTVVCKKDSTLD
jgi:hypothetical protein